MIRMSHVHKTYPTQIAALTDINLEIPPGQFVFLMGPSGSGKTTLLHILFCSERPTSGQVIVNGMEITRKDFKKIYLLRRRIGMVFQDYKLLKDRTVGENIAFALEVTDHPPAEIKKRVLEIVKWVGLLGRERDSVLTLSAGEKQQVAIARAVINNPPLLLADEPTGNLDEEMTQGVMKLFIALHRQGTTIVFATQNGDLVQRYSYPVIRLQKGKRMDPEPGGESKTGT
jgi:cell division transport system ATP-binding protein